MATIKIEITEDILKLVSNIHFKQFYKIEENDQREHISYEIDMASIFGGDFVLEDMSLILGIYDKHIEDTEDDVMGPRFPQELEDYMLNLYSFITENLDNIEEIIHQFILKGGITIGTYKCKDYQHIWEKIN